MSQPAFYYFSGVHFYFEILNVRKIKNKSYKNALIKTLCFIARNVLMFALYVSFYFGNSLRLA